MRFDKGNALNPYPSCEFKIFKCHQLLADCINYQSYIWESAAQLATMASSSVSQEDVENDFEKLEKRSRIRTARARQINPQVSPTPYCTVMCTVL